MLTVNCASIFIAAFLFSVFAAFVTAYTVVDFESCLVWSLWLPFH